MIYQNTENIIKVISFNMRRDSVFTRKNSWEFRKDIATDIIKRTNATIIGVQELMPNMRQDIKDALSGYSIFGIGRCKKSSAEHSDIIIKDSDISVINHSTFWLSKTPNKIGSRGFLAMFPRICTVVDVTILSTGQKIRVFNTHFDHISTFARRVGADIILKYIRNITLKEPLPTIIMGDLNAKPRSKEIKKFTEGTIYEGKSFINVLDYVDNDNPTILPKNTHHGFKGSGSLLSKSPIDYIFVSPDFEVVKATIFRDQIDGRYPSDHYPVIATLKLR